MTNVNYYFLLFNQTLYVFRQFDINLQTCMCSVYRDALKKKIIPCLAGRYTCHQYTFIDFICARDLPLFSNIINYITKLK